MSGFAAALGPILLSLGTLATVAASITAPMLGIGVAVAAAATLVITNWEKIVSYFKNVSATDIFSSIADQVKEMWGIIKSAFSFGVRIVKLLWERFGYFKNNKY